MKQGWHKHEGVWYWMIPSRFAGMLFFRPMQYDGKHAYKTFLGKVYIMGHASHRKKQRRKRNGPKEA